MPADPAISQRLAAHLSEQLGVWPPTAALTVATSAARTRPGWDGAVRRFAGVRSPGGTVLSVTREQLPILGDVAAGAGSLEDVRATLESVLGGAIGEAVFRWSEAPAGPPPLGEWIPAEDPRLPEWLTPFGGDVLVAWDTHGRYTAGVGCKRHDAHAWEIAVGTEERAQGRGLARRLVATAAAQVIAQGMVPLYFHAEDNGPSARVADAAGFPDRGWRLLFVSPYRSE